MRAFTMPEGGGDAAPFDFVLLPQIGEEQLIENMRSSIARGLPQISIYQPNAEVLSVAGGGPSLEDTWKELDGYIATVNQSLSFVLQKGIVPSMCGVCDPHEHMVDLVEADDRVTYFVASVVHPKLFDKLLSAGCKVVLWHALSAVEALGGILDDVYGPGKWLPVGGGSTMGVRWVPLGYLLGFRRFHLHGLDSSFRIDPLRGKASHAYPDKQDNAEWVSFNGFQTKPNFIAQVADFIGTAERFMQPDIEPVEIKMFGEGLLQKTWADWKERNTGYHDGNPKPVQIGDDFIWPRHDKVGQITQRIEAKHVGRFLSHIPGRKLAVQAGGAVGMFASHLAKEFSKVVTIEAAPENYVCLVKNVENNPKIEARHAALGDRMGQVNVVPHSPDDSGCNRVLEVDGGKVPMITIDSLDLPECDLIWLDIEGFEEKALLGAKETIARCRPAVIIEENLLPLIHGLEVGAAGNWLIAQGYERAYHSGRDALYLPC